MFSKFIIPNLPNQDRKSSLFIYLLGLIIIYGIVLRICGIDLPLNQIKKSPVFVIGETEKIRNGKEGIIWVHYKFLYKEESYYGETKISWEEKCKLDKIKMPFKALIVFYKEDPSYRRMIVSQDILKEFHIPDSIKNELESTEFSYIKK